MISFLFLIVTLAYVLLIVSFYFGCNSIETFEKTTNEPETKFSIVVPFRNEERHLPQLIASISKLNYPRTFFEVIFVDDDSDDSSLDVLNTLTNPNFDFLVFKTIRISKSPKKDAIALAVNKSKYDWIITTDADCLLPVNWLQAFNQFILSKNAHCIAAPVMLKNKGGLLGNFQVLDMLSLQGATLGAFGIGKPFLCNGANFAYTKSIFQQLKGFQGNEAIASGDDIFFLEKAIKHDKAKVNYLKAQEAIVLTEAQPTWKHFIQQRLRWASKTRAYTNSFAKLVGFTVLMTNSALVIGTLLFVINELHLKTFALVWLIKSLADALLIYKSAVFFKQKDVFIYYFLSTIIYPFVSTFIAIKSQFGSYSWKERKYVK